MNHKAGDAVPIEIQAKADEINDWITSPHGARVVAYWSEGEMGDEWKFKIVNSTTNELIVEHLFPGTADGHTYSMFMVAIDKQKKKSYSLGLARAAAEAYRMFCERLGINPDPIPSIKKGN